MKKPDPTIEALAALEHGQWMFWAHSVLLREKGISKKTRQRWESLMVPYEDLPETEKNKDRAWAQKVLDHLIGRE